MGAFTQLNWSGRWVNSPRQRIGRPRLLQGVLLHPVTEQVPRDPQMPGRGRLVPVVLLQGMQDQRAFLFREDRILSRGQCSMIRGQACRTGLTTDPYPLTTYS